MLSKHPLELPPKRELSKEEILEAIRLNIIAELDAVSLYEQLANYIQDENIKKVFLDIAKEEKTHAGEFLALLKSFDPEQAAELASGAKEVEELTGIKSNHEKADPPEQSENASDVLSLLKKKVLESADASRYLRKIVPLQKLGRGAEVVQIIEGEELKFSQLIEIQTTFSVKQREIDFWRKSGALPEFMSAQKAGMKLAKMEDQLVLFGSEKDGAKGLLTCVNAQRIEMGDWNSPNAGLADAATALGMLASSEVPRPYALLLSPNDYAKLLKHTEHTGISELKRIGELFDKVTMLPWLPEGKAVALSLSSSAIDLVVGADTEVDEIGPRDGEIEYRAWETLLLRIKLPAGIIVLEKK